MSSVECLIIDTKERLPKASPMIRLKGEASENLKFAVNEKQEHTNRLSRFLVFRMRQHHSKVSASSPYLLHRINKGNRLECEGTVTQRTLHFILFFVCFHRLKYIVSPFIYFSAGSRTISILIAWEIDVGIDCENMDVRNIETLNAVIKGIASSSWWVSFAIHHLVSFVFKISSPPFFAPLLISSITLPHPLNILQSDNDNDVEPLILLWSSSALGTYSTVIRPSTLKFVSKERDTWDHNLINARFISLDRLQRSVLIELNRHSNFK